VGVPEMRGSENPIAGGALILARNSAHASGSDARRVDGFRIGDHPPVPGFAVGLRQGPLVRYAVNQVNRNHAAAACCRLIGHPLTMPSDPFQFRAYYKSS